MEEIKIRVWDKEENRMISGDRFAFEEYAPLNDLFNNNSKRFDFMLYTGYKDINDVEIYEGDIVETTRTLNHIVGKVVMIKGCWYIQDGKDSYYRLIPRFGVVENRVIGNVYENKSLLEEE